MTYFEWPVPEGIAYLVIVGSVVFLVIGTAGIVRAVAEYFVPDRVASISPPRFMRTWHLVRDDRLPLRKMISLPDAADKAMRTTDLASDAARGLDLNPRAWMATALTGDGEIPIFGYRDEWSQLKAIPHNEFKSGTISEDCTTLKRFGEDKPRYVGLCMKIIDFKKRLAEIRTWTL